MQSARAISRMIIYFVAFSFLFGQIFSGHFNVPATLAGVFGFAVAALSGEENFAANNKSALVIATGVFCLIGVFFDALGYYMSRPSSGNYYVWVLIGPFVVAVIFIMQQFGAKLRDIDETQ